MNYEHTWHDDKMLILALRDEIDALVEVLDEVMGIALSAPSCTFSDCRICPLNRMLLDKARTLLAKVRS